MRKRKSVNVLEKRSHNSLKAEDPSMVEMSFR